MAVVTAIECLADTSSTNLTVGVIASHDDFPIERIKLDRNGKWLGSVSHDDTLKLTDVSDLFEDSDGEGDDDEMEEEEEGADSVAIEKDGDAEMTGASDDEEGEEGEEGEGEREGDEDEEMDSDEEEERKENERAKKDAKKDQKGLRGKLVASGEEQASTVGNSFFDDL
jgi:WD repeat-containing protein 55